MDRWTFCWIFLETCTYLAEVSKDRLIWHDIVQEQRTRLPFPPNARGNLEAWPTDALESLVVSNELVDDLWLIPRETPPVKLQNRRGELLLGLEIFADRWILAVYMDGYMDLWDAESLNEDRRWCFVYTGNDKTTSFKAAQDDTEDKLLVVITRAHLYVSRATIHLNRLTDISRPGTWVAVLYEILLLDPPSKLQFIPLRTFSTSSSRVARQIYIRERIIAFSQLDLIELAQWSEDSKDVIRSTILASNIQLDELEEMVGLIEISDYINSFKQCPVYHHIIPTNTKRSLYLRFQDSIYRVVSHYPFSIAISSSAVFAFAQTRLPKLQFPWCSNIGSWIRNIDWRRIILSWIWWNSLHFEDVGLGCYTRIILFCRQRHYTLSAAWAIPATNTRCSSSSSIRYG